MIRLAHKLLGINFIFLINNSLRRPECQVQYKRIVGGLFQYTVFCSMINLNLRVKYSGQQEIRGLEVDYFAQSTFCSKKFTQHFEL